MAEKRSFALGLCLAAIFLTFLSGAQLHATTLLGSPALARDGKAIRFPIAQDAFGYAIPAGPVPSATKAVTVARAVLIAIYGAKLIQQEEPLVAKRPGNIWIVSGTLNCGLSWWQKLAGNNCVGGTAQLKLAAQDGRVLHVTHYK